MSLLRLLPPVLLLAAAAGAASGQDAQDRAFDFQMKRARDLASKAVRGGGTAVAREAADAYLAAARLRPSDPVPHAEAGLLALEMGDGAGAARMLAAAHERAPGSGAYHFLRGSIFQARGEYFDGAVEFAKSEEKGFRAAEAKERRFQCRLGHGLQLVDAWRLDEALAALEEAVGMNPEHPLVSRGYYNIAIVHRRLQQPREAEKVLRKCMEKFPSYAPAYGELGDLLTEVDRHDEALRVLEMAVRVDPNYAQGFLLKAAALTAKGRLPEADEAFREFERRFPPTAESEYRRGVYHQKKGEPEKGLERLRRALALDPSRFRCHYYLALCYRDLGDDARAEEAMERWRRAEEEARKSHAQKVGEAERKAKGGAAEPPGKDEGGDPPGEDGS